MAIPSPLPPATEVPPPTRRWPAVAVTVGALATLHPAVPAAAALAAGVVLALAVGNPFPDRTRATTARGDPSPG